MSDKTGFPPPDVAVENRIWLDYSCLIDGDEFSRIQFGRAGYLPLPGLLTGEALTALRQEVEVLQHRAKRRDFQMECMGGTPRHMTTLGGREIAELAPAVAAMYHDERLLSFLSERTGLTLTHADDPVERHVLNVLHRPGDTHGLHTDDYPVALVIFLQSPSCEEGCGHLEFYAPVCPGLGGGQDGDNAPRGAHRNGPEGGSVTDGADPDRSRPALRAHQPGDAYLLRADLHPHRVRPIHEGCVRTVLNFAYGATSIPVKSTPSASILYA